MAYMEAAEGPPELRSIDELIRKHDARYGETDIGCSRAWLPEFASFVRKASGNLKDFLARLLRATTLLQTLDMPMSEEMISPKALQALKLTESQLPIVLSALGTSRNRHIVESLKGATVRMFETNRHSRDISEVYVTQEGIDTNLDTDDWAPGEEVGAESEKDGFEWIDENCRQVCTTKPKGALKTRNATGEAVASRKGAISRFQKVPKGSPGKGAKGQGETKCFRCGSPGHLWAAYPRPYAPSRGETSKKGKRGESRQEDWQIDPLD